MNSSPKHRRIVVLAVAALLPVAAGAALATPGTGLGAGLRRAWHVRRSTEHQRAAANNGLPVETC